MGFMSLLSRWWRAGDIVRGAWGSPDDHAGYWQRGGGRALIKTPKLAIR